MARLIYLLQEPSPAAQRELSYSLLSALKQGLDGVEVELWSDADNRRPDLPATPHPLPQKGRGLRAALQEALAEARGPVCVIATDTVFAAAPARLFEQIAPGRALVLARDGWLAGRPELLQRLAPAQAPASSSPPSGAEAGGVPASQPSA